MPHMPRGAASITHHELHSAQSIPEISSHHTSVSSQDSGRQRAAGIAGAEPIREDSTTVKQELQQGGVLSPVALQAMRSALSCSSGHKPKPGIVELPSDNRPPPCSRPGSFSCHSKRSSHNRSSGKSWVQALGFRGSSPMHSCVSATGKRCGPDCQGACNLCVRAGGAADLTTLLQTSDSRTLYEDAQPAAADVAGSGRLRHTGPLFRRVQSSRQPTGMQEAMAQGHGLSTCKSVGFGLLAAQHDPSVNPWIGAARQPEPACARHVHKADMSFESTQQQAPIAVQLSRSLTRVGSSATKRTAWATAGPGPPAQPTSLWCCSGQPEVANDRFDDLAAIHAPKTSLFRTHSSCKVAPLTSQPASWQAFERRAVMSNLVLPGGPSPQALAQQPGHGTSQQAAGALTSLTEPPVASQSQGLANGMAFPSSHDMATGGHVEATDQALLTPFSAPAAGHRRSLFPQGLA